MLHPNTSVTAAVRAVFVIDPEQTVRAVLYYPMNAGWMIPEILRLVNALRTSDRDGVSCPANWRRGGDAVLGARRPGPNSMPGSRTGPSSSPTGISRPSPALPPEPRAEPIPPRVPPPGTNGP